jgi:hypothetical protein
MKPKCCRYFIVFPVSDVLSLSDTDSFVHGIQGLVIRKVTRDTFMKHIGLKYYCASDSYDNLNAKEVLIDVSRTAREDVINLIFFKSLRKKIESSVKNVSIVRVG